MLEFSAGIMLATTFFSLLTIHNSPQDLAITLPPPREGYSKPKTLIAFTLGAMLFIISDENIPEIHSNDDKPNYEKEHPENI